MIAAVLKRSSFAVDDCATGREALERFEVERYPVIVLSLTSQDPTGDAEVLRLLKEKEERPCVIALSAGSQSALDRMASDLIATRLRKPFQITDLVEAVQRCFPDFVPQGRERRH